MSLRRRTAVLLSLLVGSALVAPAAVVQASSHDTALQARHSLRGPVTDENFYFVMADRFENGDQQNDRGGLSGDRMTHGFDPTSRAFYNGGDLKGLRQRIDYIQGLGTTSIWLTPSFKNKAVQPEDSSAGYHGYWITDFTQIDPHLGTNADLKALVDAAHSRGMKVYFDIITNHTADVISYGDTPATARRAYVDKDAEPYRTASGTPFDDRDFAGTRTFPALSATRSFPYTPRLEASERTLKVPSWLNDVRYYHNRGDTTFVGEDSQYGDFFGLDDLFTEHPRVVQGMIDVYKTWIRDFGVDGFRIDTMKHVDDAFWQRFGPEVLAYARAQGKREFFMFGEVFDTTKSYTSHFTTRARQQAVLDFPFQDAARSFASRGQSATALGQFFVGDDWYTDADSNVYSLPTFLGNHDMGRIGHFVQSDNPGASEQELLARDRLAHELMYFSRGNPVVYYGDEQGFTGTGGDQVARQTMFASRVADYLDDDLLGTSRTHAEDAFEPSHPLYRKIAELAALARAHPTLRNGAQQHRTAADGPGVYAFSRLRHAEQHEYVVALNNSEQARTAAVPTWVRSGGFSRVYGTAPSRLRTDSAGRLSVTVPALSAVVYRSDARIPRSSAAPAVTLTAAAPSTQARSRTNVQARVDGSSFYEVTFYARTGGTGAWRSIGTDDNAPYQVFHDTASLATGTRLEYRAVVVDNAGTRRTSALRRTAVPAPRVSLDRPGAGDRVFRTVDLSATVDPERGDHDVRFERRLPGRGWAFVATDSSSPTYRASDDVRSLPDGAQVEYRAVLVEQSGRRVASPVRRVTVVDELPTQAVIRYYRPDQQYDDWGLHLWGGALDSRLHTEWTAPRRPDAIEGGYAVWRLPLADARQALNYIIHKPGGDSVPTTREPGGDRSFVPLQNPNVPAEDPQVWVVAGDPTIRTSPPARP